MGRSRRSPESCKVIRHPLPYLLLLLLLVTTSMRLEQTTILATYYYYIHIHSYVCNSNTVEARMKNEKDIRTRISMISSTSTSISSINLVAIVTCLFVVAIVTFSFPDHRLTFLR